MANWDANNLMFAGLFGGGLFIGLVACIGGFLHARRERMLTHAERMKALELGREMPDDPATARLKAFDQAETPETPSGQPIPPKSRASQCYSTTGYVCATGFVFAFVSGSNLGVAVAIASATGAIGVTGMICGTILAAKSPEPHPIGVESHPNKPYFDPEAV